MAEPSARDLLLKSFPGRLFIVAAALKLVIALLRRVIELPAFVQLIGSAATIALVLGVGYFLWRLFVLMKRRLLWRVRRKLILSYIFIGVVPALLIIGFFLLAASIVTMNLSAFLFKNGYGDLMEDARILSQGAAAEIGRTPPTAATTLARMHQSVSRKHRGAVLAFVPSSPDAPPRLQAGRWEHQPPPDRIPEWLRMRGGDGFTGTIVVTPPGSNGEAELVARSVAPVETAAKLVGYVVVDIPLDGEKIATLYDSTGVRSGSVTVSTASGGPAPVLEAINRQEPDEFSLFRKSVAFLDYTEWVDGTTKRASVAMSYRVGDLYNRLARAQSAQLLSMPLADAIRLMLVFVAALFLIIQIVALIMGLALARSITSSIHELFMGTERVRQGDFTHRINIQTKDQLGELAGSFNQMTGSIENLLQTAAEKKRLEEELRIARQIQMSLLPRGPLDFPGLTVTALCVPAREVGGDYYDFFRLQDEKLGVLIADVSGKGTSAALYMAELKGLVLSLSQIYESPRQLLIEVNRIISDNLDTRSFITMTYAVIDLRNRVMTYARAGHTPMIYLCGSTVDARAQILVPDGLVVGLRIDGAAQKFTALLKEERIALNGGDVVVFYTDGITEAMNGDSDLFGESRLSSIIEEHGHLDSSELRERILREIEAFVGGADQHDDMTMILMKVDQPAAVRKVS